MPVLLLALVLAAGLGPRIGDPAPAVPLLGLDGGAVTVPTGRPVAISFFATWCEPCHKATADLLALRQLLGGFTIVLVAVGEPAKTVRLYLAAHPLPPEVLVVWDADGSLARAWGHDRLPTTFLVDTSRVIRHINRGWGNGYRARMERWLRAIR